MAKRGRKSLKELLENKDKIDLWKYGTVEGKYSKYKAGKVIKTVDEFLKQKVVIWHNECKNVEIIKSLQFRFVLRAIESGSFRYAVLKKKDKSERNEIKRNNRNN